MIRSVRAQLTLWYVGVLALVLISLSVASYFVAKRLLYRRLDASLAATLVDAEKSIAEQVSASQPSGQVFAAALDRLHYPNRTIWVLSQDGEVLATRKAAAGPPLRFPKDLRAAASYPRYYELDDEAGTDTDESCHGVFQLVSSTPDNHYVLVAAQSDELLSDELDSLQNIALVLVPMALLLAGGGGWFLARRSLTPIAWMARTVRQITAQNLEGRVPIRNPDDEIGTLSTEFNDLLDRLSAALTQQRQFMTDASHELRTPLSVLRTAAEVTLDKKGRSEDEYREALAIVRQQAGRLSHLVDGMFALSRADMGQQSMHAADFYLEEVVHEVVGSASVLATRKRQRIETQIAGESPCHGDEELIRQMILALLDNAIKYTPQGGRINVTLEHRNGSYAIVVGDSGPGIPAADQPRIFDRFFRSDRSRTTVTGNGGTGLGLAIARSIAELHHGRLTLERSDSSGTLFLILLPRSS